ncbi:hypothetical protein PR202_ga09646 [Eleusine coracana subsp. coracana]|uniref:Uncharacterized protein n=1 Tax=Eleusine coracana subsp. coracana TaxID=191504 RepID=A0AAV5C578_ELECO|nr:hypothetical protein PR202_ga09646 [Eleusine coracana subsp. coracana]
MGRYGPLRIASRDGGGCLPLPIVISEAVLAVVDGAIAAVAFVQIFHFLIGLSNVASPQILLLVSFLLLLSFWVDLCHQSNDEDEDDVRSHHEALLDRTKTEPGFRPVNIRQRCCPGIQLGSRQKFVILASSFFPSV